MKISIAALAVVALQLVGIAWWASEMTARVTFIERSMQDRADVTSRLTKLEVTTSVQGESLQRDMLTLRSQVREAFDDLKDQIRGLAPVRTGRE